MPTTHFDPEEPALAPEQRALLAAQLVADGGPRQPKLAEVAHFLEVAICFACLVYEVEDTNSDAALSAYPAEGV